MATPKNDTFTITLTFHRLLCLVWILSHYKVKVTLGQIYSKENIESLNKLISKP